MLKITSSSVQLNFLNWCWEIFVIDLSFSDIMLGEEGRKVLFQKIEPKKKQTNFHGHWK